MTWPERFLLVLVVGIIVWAQVADGPSYKAGYRAGYRKGRKDYRFNSINRYLTRPVVERQPTGAAWRRRMARVEEDARVRADEMENTVRKAYQARDRMEYEQRGDVLYYRGTYIPVPLFRDPDKDNVRITHECEPGLIHRGYCLHCGRHL